MPSDVFPTLFCPNSGIFCLGAEQSTFRKFISEELSKRSGVRYKKSPKSGHMNRYGSDRSQNRHGLSSTIHLARKKNSDTSENVCSLMTALENFYSKFRSQLSEEIHVDWTDRRLLCSRPRRSDSWHLRVLMDYLKRNLAPWDHPNTPIMFTDTLLTGILRWEFRNFSLISLYWAVLGASFRTAAGYQRDCFYFTW